MTININENICNKYGLELSEVLALLLIKSCEDSPVGEVLKSLEERKMIINIGGDYLITQRWDDVVSNIILDSDKNEKSIDEIENLALKLMELFPKCKKEGTCHYYRGNKKDNTLRLKKFFKLYGSKYSDEQIINAAKRYVESFNGNYMYMRILKYFIWKDEKRIGEDGKAYIEETSDLATLIENEDVEDNNDWLNELR